jgi:ligand-binding sensor domain-containing protein
VFQDRSGNLWFGTNGDGVLRYDGKSLKSFSTGEGFVGLAVRGIAEDRDGNVWFATSGGLTRYDGVSFTNFTEQHGLLSEDVWCLAVDGQGTIWVGTLHGVSRFDGAEFTPFHIPAVEPDPARGVTGARMVHSIMEDSRGRMWFGTSGGAYVYDGETLSNISDKDGLCNDTVNCILEDRRGRFWFATHHAGVCRMDGSSFTHITAEDGVRGTGVWDL